MIPTQLRAGLKIARLLRQRVPVEAFETGLRDRLARREENFLSLAERFIFSHTTSPYRPLFSMAGYDLPRLRQLVLTKGLDAALDQLCEDGVYVRVAEFKGTVPTLRRGHNFQFQPQDFANPSTVSVLRTRSSGSRGTSRSNAISIEDLLYHTHALAWVFAHYGLAERDLVLWRSAGTGLLWTLSHSILGRPPMRWVSPVKAIGRSHSLLFNIIRTASGIRLPRMEYLPADRTVDLARFISQHNTSRGMLVDAFDNSALRLVLAAEEAGIRLSDVVFIVSGEPLTPAKRRQIEARGFKVFSRFAFSELGTCAWSCPHGREADDLHILIDRVAVRQYRREVGGDGASAPAYLFTTLLPHARNILVNVETGDFGDLEERRCGCFLDDAGLHLHIHTIRSFEKLTAEGITYFGASLIDLVEDVLPREFGGDSRHYQLVEAEDEQGFTRLFLLISPAVGPLDEDAVRRTVLREIGRRHLGGSTYGEVVERTWAGAGTIKVLRRDSLATSTGKILHLHKDRTILFDRNGEEDPP